MKTRAKVFAVTRLFICHRQQIAVKFVKFLFVIQPYPLFFDNSPLFLNFCGTLVCLQSSEEHPACKVVLEGHREIAGALELFSGL